MVVHPDSHRISRVPRYSGTCLEFSVFRIQDYHPLWSPFPEEFCYTSDSLWHAPQPRPAEAGRFRLFPFRSPLLRKSRLLSFPGVTEMVHFSPFALSCLWIQQEVFRKSPGLRLFAPTRGLSQLTTSFVAYPCQGIHRMPLLA
jgi:hypothetical protein